MKTEDMPIDRGDQLQLIQLARDSIKHGLLHSSPLPEAGYKKRGSLAEKRASFVTLRIDDRLRGCVGSLEADCSLADDVVKNAYAAANLDYRFTPLTAVEFENLQLEISVLSPWQPLVVESEAELCEKLRPGIDGLVLKVQSKTATFLPAVWQSLPEKKDFLGQLKKKAGLSTDYWSAELEFLTYQAFSFR